MVKKYQDNSTRNRNFSAVLLLVLCTLNSLNAAAQFGSSQSAAPANFSAFSTQSEQSIDSNGKLAKFIDSSEHNSLRGDPKWFAIWIVNTPWVRQWASLSPFGAKYLESASYLGDVKIGSRIRSADNHHTKEELRVYYQKLFPELRPDQIDRITTLFFEVNRNIEKWLLTIRDLDLDNNVALEFAAAADDARAGQLYQEIVLGKATAREADIFIPKYEAIGVQFINNLEIKK